MNPVIHFDRMDEPNIYGYSATREDGLTVEVVRCYEEQWNVFLTRAGSVVAVSVEEYRACGHGYVPRKEAFRIARSFFSNPKT